MADRSVQFISKTELNAKKEEKRKAREQILQQAKAEYERQQQRKEKRKATGEDTWMLPSVSHRIADDDEIRKKKKRKKEKKAKDKKTKKHKKKSKKEKDTSSDSDSDEWVEKVTTNESDTTKPDKMETALPQRDGWMLFPCFGESSTSQLQVKNESDDQDSKENEQKSSAIDMAGQHSRELNPYWKDGGTGLPTERPGINQTSSESKTVYDAKWLKKALQRAKEQADEEGCSVEEMVADRWGSLARLQDLIKDAEKRVAEEERLCAQQTHGRMRSHNRDKESLHWKKDDWHRSRRENKDQSREKYLSYEREDDSRRKRYDYKGKDSPSYSVNKDKYKYNDGKHYKDFKQYSDNDKSHHQERSYKDKISRKSSPEHERLESRTEKVHEGGFASPFRKPDSHVAKSSCKFMKPSDDDSSSLSSIGSSRHGLSSGGWKKKTENEEPRVNRIEQAMKKLQENDSDDSDSNSSDSDDDDVKSENNREENHKHADEEESELVKAAVPAKKITEADLNNMGAKILKAELMGNEDLAVELKAKLEQMRTDKEAQESLTSNTNKLKTEEEVVVLTRTDKFGNTRPVTMNEMQEPKRGRRKREKVATHGDSGQRERYFADDDRYDLNEIVRREKMNTAEDYNDMFSRLASKGAGKTDSDDFTLDDHFVSGASKKFSKAQEEERDKMKAIKEHQRLSAQLSKCRFCFENPDLAKHLIIAIGIQVYLAVPLHTSLTDGHCLIIPMQHQVGCTYLDEDVVDEIKVFKKGLTRMFLEMEKDVIFLETCRNISRQKHMIIECIPVPKEEGDLAPMYFKKAILESDSEWAHNKKLIDTSKKGLIASVPKGLPFFSVEFGLDGGFAHIIEEEHLFPHYFGKEIIGGMLDLEPWTWHKPHKENFEQHKKKVLQFADWWKPYDWTKRLMKNKT